MSGPKHHDLLICSLKVEIIKRHSNWSIDIVGKGKQ